MKMPLSCRYTAQIERKIIAWQWKKNSEESEKLQSEVILVHRTEGEFYSDSFHRSLIHFPRDFDCSWRKKLCICWFEILHLHAIEFIQLTFVCLLSNALFCCFSFLCLSFELFCAFLALHSFGTLTQTYKSRRHNEQQTRGKKPSSKYNEQCRQ